MRVLIGMKSIANYVGVTVQTLKRWRKYRAPLPSFKSHPSRQGRVVISLDALHKWMEFIGVGPDPGPLHKQHKRDQKDTAQVCAQ